MILFFSKKASDFFLINRFLKKYLSLKRFIKYRFDKNYAYSILQESSNRWSNNKLSIDQIIENVDEKLSIYDDMIIQNDLEQISQISYISFPRNTPKKNKLKFEFSNDSHWNSLGHRIVAEEIAKELNFKLKFKKKNKNLP